jgi:hypothetical protein
MIPKVAGDKVKTDTLTVAVWLGSRVTRIRNP